MSQSRLTELEGEANCHRTNAVERCLPSNPSAARYSREDTEVHSIYLCIEQNENRALK